MKIIVWALCALSISGFALEPQLKEYEESLWHNYLLSADHDADRKTQHQSRQLRYGNKTMKFSLDKKGTAQPSGYPVYIALHGGGTAPAWLNDGQWDHMQIYYKNSVDNGIYIAPRGVSDTWDLHFQEESYPLYDRLIENLIAYENADPNRIYFLGFSAGGDGVYQVVPRMSDRFAAANMSAGHHNWIKFDNLLNTPFLIQMGELDGSYGRNTVAGQNYITLNNLQKLHGGYIHDAFIHYDGYHNGWYDNDATGGLHTIIKDPRAWSEKGDRTQKNINTNAVHWLNNYQRSLPKKIIWDLSTRAARTTTWGAGYAQNPAEIKAARDLFYWLALDEQNITAGRIEAEIDSAQNAVIIHKAEGISNLTILLHQTLFDFSKPIAVYFNGQKISEVQPEAKRDVMARTLLERGDRSFVFHDEIKLHLSSLATRSADDKFSYCSNGNCYILSAKDFLQSKNFPLDLNYTCKNNKDYALTFDDGPSPNIPALLEILARHQAVATFFVVGQNLATDEAQQRLRDIASQGHEIANHTFTHRSLIHLTPSEIEKELLATQNAINAALAGTLHIISSVVRPPFGEIDGKVQEVINALGLKSVRWNSDRYDWKEDATKETVLARIKQHLSFNNHLNSAVKTSIIDVNHDWSAATLAAIDEALTLIKAQGYRLVSMSECLGL